MKVLVAHPGTQHSQRLAAELERIGRLGEFWGGIAFGETGLLASVARRAARLPRIHRLRSRLLEGVPSVKVHALPVGEIRALARLRFGQDSHSVLHERNAKFQLAIPDRALTRNQAIVGFDTSSWILAQRCRKLGRPFFLDRSIAHPAAVGRLLKKFAAKYPEWSGSFESRPPEVAKAEQAEHDLAHRIVVAGSFARDTLVAEGLDPAKIRVNPYGVDWAFFSRASQTECETRANRPLRFLFVGSVIARKGIPVLLDAWRGLSNQDAELWLVGHVGSKERALIPPMRGLRILGQLSRAELATTYSKCDVFVLPSLFEGFGLVILEALAAGLPVISTVNTAARDLIQDPALGHAIEPGATEPLLDAMRSYLDSPPSRMRVREVAESLAPSNSWAAYARRWAGLLDEAN